MKAGYAPHRRSRSAARCCQIAVAALLMCFTATAGAAAAADDDREVAFDIPAEPLSKALIQFGEQARIQVIVAHNIADGLTSPQIKGILHLRAALTLLLRGSGLSYEETNSNTIIVTPASTNETASVKPFRVASDASGSSDRTTDSAGSSTNTAAAAIVNDSSHEGGNLAEVVITGTHISGKQPASPVITVDRTDINQSGYQNVGQLIRNLPESFGGGQNIGTYDAQGSQNAYTPSSPSTVNLRGLGSESTLTLINGRRFAYDGQTPSVDISVIPLQAIKRVEILTDGASAIYGSDAVAGVANFILRDDFEGLLADASVGTATDGGALQQQYTALGGTRWDGGNILLTYEFERQNPVDAGTRPDSADPLLAGSWLWPSTRRSSVFGAISQRLTPNITASIQGLYTHRKIYGQGTYAIYGVPTEVGYSTTPTVQYGVSPGLTIRFGGDWLASVDGNFSEDSDEHYSVTLNPGKPASIMGNVYHNRLATLDANVDGTLLTLPAGALKMAAGGGIRAERFREFPVPDRVTSNTSSGSRTVYDAYAELSAPIIGPTQHNTLDLVSVDLAGRYERYTDFGNTFDWKVGLALQPTPDLKLRATYGTAFRAPGLWQEHSGVQGSLLSKIPDPYSSTGTTTLLLVAGANPGLQPEKSDTASAGIDFSPHWAPGFSASLSWFDIRYRDRIAMPATIFARALTDPALAHYVVLNPSPALQATILSEVDYTTNHTGSAYDPATVGGFFDDRVANFSTERAQGVDFITRYRHRVAPGTLDLSFNASYQTLRQRFLAGAPELTLSGTIFNPPRLRMRGGASWEYRRWNISLIGNYSGPAYDPAVVPQTQISSWTTFDATARYRMWGEQDKSNGTLSVSSQNLFNRAPPYVNPISTAGTGAFYDGTNANIIGRFVSADISIQW